MYNLKYFYNFTGCNQILEEDNFKKFVEYVNKFKNHPALFAWFINDEEEECLNKYLRNRTLTIHELDQNHPTASAIGKLVQMKNLINTTDLISLFRYPLNKNSYPIRMVYDDESKAFNYLLYSRPSWPIIQVFDKNYYQRELGPSPPTLQEMII